MTAVITKYRSTFDKWVEQNSHWPNPIHISCMEDIGDQYFFFVKSINHSHYVFNVRQVKKKCIERICLKVGIIGWEPKEAKDYNLVHKEKNAVCIFDKKSASKYYYTNVIMGQSAPKLGPIAIDLLCICESRIIVKT